MSCVLLETSSLARLATIKGAWGFSGHIRKFSFTHDIEKGWGTLFQLGYVFWTPNNFFGLMGMMVWSMCHSMSLYVQYTFASFLVVQSTLPSSFLVTLCHLSLLIVTYRQLSLLTSLIVTYRQSQLSSLIERQTGERKKGRKGKIEERSNIGWSANV